MRDWFIYLLMLEAAIGLLLFLLSFVLEYPYRRYSLTFFWLGIVMWFGGCLPLIAK